MEMIADRPRNLDALYQLPSLPEIADWIVLNRDLVEPLGGSYEEETGRIKKIIFSESNFGLHSNEHSAPFGKETNWYRTRKKPMAYWGMSGIILAHYTDDPMYDPDFLGVIGINTYSGHGGFQSYHTEDGDKRQVYTMKWHYTIWFDDFPGLLTIDGKRGIIIEMRPRASAEILKKKYGIISFGKLWYLVRDQEVLAHALIADDIRDYKIIEI